MSNFGETNSADTAVIPQGTVINGNITITGKLEMHGAVNGNIDSNDRVDISGNVTGNINANDLYTKDSYIVGQIKCVQGAVVRENTVILGDINAEDLVVDGAIQGRLDIRNSITVGETAILDSDIKARTIQVNNGAALNGHCSMCYADVNINEIFPAVEEPEPKPELETEAEPDPEIKKPKASVRPKAVKKADN